MAEGQEWDERGMPRPPRWFAEKLRAYADDPRQRKIPNLLGQPGEGVAEGDKEKQDDTRGERHEAATCPTCQARQGEEEAVRETTGEQKRWAQASQKAREARWAAHEEAEPRVGKLWYWRVHTRTAWAGEVWYNPANGWIQVAEVDSLVAWEGTGAGLEKAGWNKVRRWGPAIRAAIAAGAPERTAVGGRIEVEEASGGSAS